MFDSFRFLQLKDRITIYAYILMENHLHMVAAAYNLSKELSNFKSYTARRSIDYYKSMDNTFILDQLRLQQDPGDQSNREFRFWQAGYGPKRIQNREMMIQKIEYIHHNPVRRGYVDKPEYWRYSSARNYAGMAGLIEVCMDW